MARAGNRIAALTGSEMCMHAGFGPVRINQSVGSLVSHLSEAGHTHWVTATSAPCTGIFKPVWIDAGYPDTGKAPAGSSRCWLPLVAARALAPDGPAGIIPPGWLHSGRSGISSSSTFLQGERDLRTAPAGERFEFSKRCFQLADAATGVWEGAAGSVPVVSAASPLYRIAWNRFNQQADFPN